MSARVVDVFFMHRAGVGFNLASLHGNEVPSRDVYLSPESDALLRQCGTITIRVVDPVSLPSRPSPTSRTNPSTSHREQNAQRRRKERIRTSNPRDVPLSVALSLWTKLEVRISVVGR